MSNYTIRPEDQNEYTLTPLPGVDQTLLTDIGETIYVPLATNTTYGVIKPGDSLSVTNGVLNVEKATENSFGSVKPGVGLSVTNGVLNVEKATENSFGSVKPGVGLSVTNGVLNVEKSEIDLGNVSDAALVQLQANIDAIKNNTTPIKASNGSVQLGERSVGVSAPSENTLQFRDYTFMDKYGHLQTFTGSEMTKVADIQYVANEIVDNVTDNLITEDPTKALSAKQGKLLKDLIDGKQQTETYSNISAMVSALNSASSTQFKQGYNFYIIDTEVPDFWVAEVKSTSSTYTYTTDAALVNAVKQAPVQIGYYKISLLETAKVETKDAIDSASITRNTSDELQAVGVIDQKTGNANKQWTGTLEEYNSILVKDNNTDYIITDDENEIGIIPDCTSDLINDSGFITKDVDNLTNYTKTSSLGTLATKNTVNYETEVTNKPSINNGTLTIQKNGTTVATFTANSSSDVTANILADTQTQVDWNQSDSSKVDYIKNKPTIPTVNNGTITIQKNGTTVNSFTTNQNSDTTINITVPTQASDVGALADSTKYGASVDLSVNSSTYVLTAQLKDQDGNAIGSAATVDLPLESIIFSATYYATYTYDGTTYSKVIVITLSTTDVPTIIPVGDLVSGLVPDSRTIAGVDLQDNITKSELATALGVQADLNLLNGEGSNSLKMKNNNTVSGGNSFAEGSNNVVFADNAHAEGLSVTKATSRGITASSTDAEIQTEWLASDPEGDKFSLAKGENSHIEGSNCLALGSNSHAEGNGTRAINNSAHTEGTGTVASGKYSHAEGLETVASGARAHSEGDSTVASGDYSHAQGRSTNATHAYSFTSGRNTSSSADYQTVLGKYSASDSQATLIVSTGSKNSARNSFATGHDGSANFLKLGSVKLTEGELSDIKQGGNIPQGVVSYESIISTSGNGNALTNFTIGSTGDILLTKGITAVETSRTIAGLPLSSNITSSALRTAMSLPSAINGTANDSIIMNDIAQNVASGECCFAEGKQNTASGALGAHAEGYYNVASGSHSHAEGEHNTSSGQNAHTEGWYNTASGYGTHAEGGRNVASYEYAHAEGQYTESNGFAAHSEGCRTLTGTLARQSHAEGYYTEALNYQSHAEGDYSVAGFNDDTVPTFDLTATYAEGNIVKNNGLYYLCIKASTGNALDNTTYWNQIQSNHAEGQNTRSTSVASHAEGVNSIASGKASHAEGNGTYATNNAAHSEGTGSQATGKYSHAEGLESVASGSRSHAEGYTTTASGDSAHAQGRDTVASGKYSFASGRGTTASKENQTALGQYNATDNEALLIVGTGSKSGDTVNARNSFAAGHDGTASFIKVGSTKFRETELAKKSDIPDMPATTTAGQLVKSTSTSGTFALGNGLPYITTEPSAANTDGLIIVVLSSEPTTRYSGYIYIITTT